MKSSGRRKADRVVFSSVDKKSLEFTDQTFLLFKLRCTSLMIVYMIALHSIDPSSIFRGWEL